MNRWEEGVNDFCYYKFASKNGSSGQILVLKEKKLHRIKINAEKTLLSYTVLMKNQTNQGKNKFNNL